VSAALKADYEELKESAIERLPHAGPLGKRHIKAEMEAMVRVSVRVRAPVCVRVRVRVCCVRVCGWSSACVGDVSK